MIHNRPNERRSGDKVIPGITALATSVAAIATTIVAAMTFVQKTEHEQAESDKSIIESAVSTDMEKERAALYAVTEEAIDRKVPVGFALCVLGTVLRNSTDEKVHREVYDNIVKLMDQTSRNPKDLNKYDNLELCCLRAALTPVQSHRQKNIRKIEEIPDSDSLKLQAQSRLLELSQVILDPQASIDMLLSISGRYEFPDMIEKMIPILRAAAKRRDNSLEDSNDDIAEFLLHASRASASFAEAEEKNIVAIPETHSVAHTQEIDAATRNVKDITDEARAAARDAYRSQIRLSLARALIMKDSSSRKAPWEDFSRVVIERKLEDDAQRLLSGISRNNTDEGDAANLKMILGEASEYLNLAKQNLVKEKNGKRVSGEQKGGDHISG
jgi:hypothetical protein